MHPEIDKYGLTGDFNLWAELNKEKLIRKWIHCYRTLWINVDMPENIPTEGIEADCGNSEERELAELALEELIESDNLDPITYLRKDRR